MKTIKNLSVVALTFLMLGVFGVCNTPAYANNLSNKGANYSKDKRPNPTPTPKPGPRDGGADD